MVAELLHGIGNLLILGAGTASTATIGATVAPQWKRIARLACGHRDPIAAPIAPTEL